MGPLAGMGLGILKSELIDRPKEMREREIAATTAALSPWTGLKAGPVKEASWSDAAMQGGLTGAQMDQDAMAQKQAQVDQEVYNDYLRSKTSPGTK